MNENLILVVDYDKICRLCLHSTGAMSDLFESGEEISLKQLVHRATGLDVEENDGFPSNICHRCRYIVELNCELREMAAKSYTLLINASCNIQPSEIQSKVQDIIPKKNSRKEKPDLRLIMQDNGVMTLVKPDPGTPVNEMPENIEDCNIDNVERKEKKKEVNRIISRPRSAPPKRLTCQICLTTFCSEDDVDSHVTVHYMDSDLTPYTRLQRPFKCEACRKTVSKTQLIRHHRNHLNINSFVCKHAGCEYIGQSQDSFRRHLLTHASRSQVCELCGATYKRRFELRQHMLRAHRPAPAHCRYCRKRFRNAITLRAHLQQYHKPRRYTCDWPGCTKAYHTPGPLEVHTRTHTGQRIFRCHLCSAAAYTSQSMLNRHLRMHERARLSKCDKCLAMFDDYGAFYTHRVTEHGEWMRYRCVGCNKRYHTEPNLEQHMESCEQAIAMRSIDDTVQTDTKTEQMLVTSIQKIMNCENKTIQLEEVMHEEITEDLLDKFKGQSLLVQPGNISDLSKDLELQDLPPDGLLYIEVDPEADDNVHDEWQQQFTGQKG